MFSYKEGLQNFLTSKIFSNLQYTGGMLINLTDCLFSDLLKTMLLHRSLDDGLSIKIALVYEVIFKPGTRQPQACTHLVS